MTHPTKEAQPMSRKLWRTAANLTTTLVMLLGLLAIQFRDNERTGLALLLLAAFGDYIDGQMARRAGGGSSYGSWMDILSDIIAFGIAPIALIGFRAEPIPLSLIVAMIVYLAASAWRLYRTHRMTFPPGFGYLGLPMPSVGGLALALGWTLPVPTIFLGLYLVSALAISRKRYPTIGMIWRANRLILIGALIVGLVLAAFGLYAQGLLVFMLVISLYPWVMTL